jgi:hypothetical protein
MGLGIGDAPLDNFILEFFTREVMSRELRGHCLRSTWQVVISARQRAAPSEI